MAEVGSTSTDVKKETVSLQAPLLNKTFEMSGKAGKPFNIDGEGFGDGSGDSALSVSGRLVQTSRWTDKSIKGQLPKDIKPGNVVVHTSDGRDVTGKFSG